MNPMLVFEENGFPVELHTPREVERAVANGRLRADTIVKTGFDEGAPRTSRAQDVPSLRLFLGLPDPASPLPPPLPPALAKTAAVPATPASSHSPTPAQASATRPSVVWRAPEPAAGVPDGPAASTHSLEVEVDRGDGYREPVGVVECALMPLRRYAAFEGRSSLREVWLFVAVQLGGLLLLAALDAPDFLVGLAILAMFVPNLAVAARRLHDQDRSGWWLLLAVVPYIGWLIVSVMTLLVEGTRAPNRFGPSPKGRT